VVYTYGFLEAQWRFVSDSTSVLYDFLKLAHTDVMEETGFKAVANFAHQWGPLWLCRTPQHTNNCHWRPEVSLSMPLHKPDDLEDIFPSGIPGVGYQMQYPCIWYPLEEAAVFVQKALQVQTVLSAAELLQRNSSVPASWWQRMGWGKASEITRAPTEEQRKILSFIVHFNLGLSRGPQLGMEWENEPKLIIAPPLGFIHVVWLAVAERLCEAKGVYQCSECGKFYVRSGRRPRTSSRNFCPSCGTKAAKRQWARRKRGEPTEI
jgi:hypothetical protein